MKIAHIYIQNFRGIKSLSWRIKGDFNCLIGAGDTCKSTILTALNYALSPRNFLSIDDSDFYNLDVGQRVVIQVTLIDWDESLPEVKRFFSENKCAQYQCGLNDSGPLPEPEESKKNAVSISLTFDDSLEPVWSAEKGTRKRGRFLKSGASPKCTGLMSQSIKRPASAVGPESPGPAPLKKEKSAHAL